MKFFSNFLEKEHQEHLEEIGFYQKVQDEENLIGIFNPPIDQILWRRPNTKQGKEGKSPFEYYIKYTDYSYLHCKWISEEQVLSLGKNGKTKLNRFNWQFNKKIAEGVKHFFNKGNYHKR